MKWVGISGSWRTTNEAVRDAVRAEVQAIHAKGDGVVTGGALGVDFIATEESLRIDPTASRLKIILPTPLTTYKDHYLRRAGEGVITFQQAWSLIRQLEQVQQAHPAHLVEMGHDVCTPETYYARNAEVVAAADALAAFQVNGTAGTQDTIDRAHAKGIPVTHHQFSIEPDMRTRSTS